MIQLVDANGGEKDGSRYMVAEEFGYGKAINQTFAYKRKAQLFTSQVACVRIDEHARDNSPAIEGLPWNKYWRLRHRSTQK